MKNYKNFSMFPAGNEKRKILWIITFEISIGYCLIKRLEYIFRHFAE